MAWRLHTPTNISTRQTLVGCAVTKRFGAKRHSGTVISYAKVEHLYTVQLAKNDLAVIISFHGER